MMGYRSKMDYLRTIYYRYHKATNDQKSRMLDELCKVCGYNRKYAIRRLSSPLSTISRDLTMRPSVTFLDELTGQYLADLDKILADLWEFSGNTLETVSIA
jgi:hypothetical protein